MYRRFCMAIFNSKDCARWVEPHCCRCHHGRQCVARRANRAAGRSPPGTVNVDADPIRCWWRTSANAVRVGEPFSLILTCAIVENETTTVVPDLSRLDPAAMQLPPFEVTGRPARARSPQRLAPVLSVSVHAAADQRGAVREGRAHSEHPDQLPPGIEGRARRNGQRPRPHLHSPVGVDPRAVPRAGGRIRHS